MRPESRKARRLDLAVLAARLFLGGVFFYASVDKILYPADFARAVYNYQILPDGLINLTALVMPWLELLLGVSLVTGLWLPGAVLWSNGLLWVFFLALLFNLLRGLDVHCGCFSTRPDPAGLPSTAWYLFRDLAFLVAGGFLSWRLFITRYDHRELVEHPFSWTMRHYD